MAFSFGASSSSTPSLFGASSTPAFGASTGATFVGSTPAFGASSTPSLFGGFGASSSTPSLFGGTPASQPAQKAGGFSFASTSGNLFGSSTPAFGQTQSSFGSWQQQQPQVPQAGPLSTVDNKQLTHYTKWEEINPEGQRQLLELERMVSQTREECRQLEECARLQKGHTDEPGTSEALKHTLQGFVSSWRSDDEAITALDAKVHELLHDTETAIRAFQRSFKWREAAKTSQGQVLPPALREMLNGPVVLPSQFLRKAIRAFQENVEQYQTLAAELEKVVPFSAGVADSQRRASAADEFLRSLPAALSNIHDLLYHVAAKIDALHERIADAKDKYLEDRRQAGETRDPFKEAERREKQKERAARNKVTIIPPAWSQAAATPSSVPLLTAAGNAATSSPGTSLYGNPSSLSPFGGQPAGSTLFGQSPAVGFGGSAFGQNNPARSSSMRKSKAKK